MKMVKKLMAAVCASALLSPVLSFAAPVVYNLALPNISTFDNVIVGTGSAVQVVQVVGGQSVYNYTPAGGGAVQTLTVTRPNGSAVSPSGGYSSNGTSLSGSVFDIGPNDNGTDAIPGQSSGLRFTFSSAINAFGFEIGDWATCCTSRIRPASVVSTYGVPIEGSGLWISFNGGAATLPANALTDSDNPGFALSGSYTNFIGAIDSSSTFTTIDFWGDGFGEVLFAGGSFRFASVPIGSVGGQIPEPGSLALVGLAILGLAAVRRRKVQA